MRASLIACLLVATLVGLGRSAEGAVVFEEDVQPILSTYCLTCHGKSSPEQGLDLRTARSVLRGGFNGPVVTKGSPDKSKLYQYVSQGKMPPPAFKSKVPEADAETIRLWIESGARVDESGGIPESARSQIARFEQEIQPLLRERCTTCHGAGDPQSGLDLRTLASTLRGGKHGPVVVEGFADKSILIRQLVSGAMPPSGAAKPLLTDQIKLIRSWIDEGNFADYVDLGNPLDRAFTEAEAPLISATDRRHWAFRRPIASEPPAVAGRERVRNPIDAFIIKKLEDSGLTLSPQASRQSLLRRAYFDLWGLPPTQEDAAQFLADTRPDAFAHLVDRLLESPLYGQRWGRFWLDAAGYVDTSGKDFQADQPTLAPGMWRYRDYVIDAFNNDKPWNLFLTEQLAGDEIHDWRNADRYTPEMVESLIATGYLRTVLDATNEDISDRPADRYNTLFALIDKVSRSAIGLTLSCAQCHSHKFDPIPQRDYYRFLALLSPAYNPSDWIQPKNRLLYTVSRSEKERIDQHNAVVDREAGALENEIEEVSKPYRESVLEAKLANVPSEIRDDLRRAVQAIAKDRSEVEKYLVEKFGDSVSVSESEILAEASEADRQRLAELHADLRTWKGYRNKPQQIQALWDGPRVPMIRLLQRGSVESPGPAVKPGFLSILCEVGDDCLAVPSPNLVGATTGYRLSLAEWLTNPDHPLTARVIVNRIWQHHFGTGIVATADNFGREGTPPSHPALLDWLAVDFVRHGWRTKRLHKLIMLSAAYQQSSRRADNPLRSLAESKDPENRLLWRMPLRRLDAEALRDSILAVAGRLNRSLGGPPVPLDARPDGLQVASGQGANRRSVYLLARRTWPSTFMGTFDFPNIDTTCIRRSPSATPLQSLAMMNSDFVFENATAVAGRLTDFTTVGATDAAAIALEAYRLLLTRDPTSEEVEFARDHLERQRQLYARANATKDEALAESAASLAQMLMTSNEFLYVD